MAAQSIQLYYKLESVVGTDRCSTDYNAQVDTFYHSDPTPYNTVDELRQNDVLLFLDPDLLNPVNDIRYFADSAFPSVTGDVDTLKYDRNLVPKWSELITCPQATGGAVPTANVWFKSSDDVPYDSPCEPATITNTPIYWSEASYTTLEELIDNGETIFAEDTLTYSAPKGWYGDLEFPGSGTATIAFWDPAAKTWSDKQQCTGTGGAGIVFTLNAYFDNGSDGLICSPDGSPLLVTTTVFYYSTTPLTITQLVSGDVPIFITSEAAQKWGLGINPNKGDAAPSGYYRQSGSASVGLWRNQNSASSTWVPAPDCVFPPTQNVYEIDLLTADLKNPLSRSEFCCKDKRIFTFYYLSDTDYESDLMAIANAGLFIFTRSTAAEVQDYNYLALSSIYNADVDDSDDKLLAFVNDGPNSLWIGHDIDGNPVQRPDIKEYMPCPTRPDINQTENIVSSSPFANKVYYSFYSCNASLSGVYRMYLVDGQHFNNVDNFMSAFIDKLRSFSRYTFNSDNSNVGCVTYAHKIIAESIDEAEYLLSAHDPNYDFIQQAELSELGISNNATMFLYLTCCDCLSSNGKTEEYTFDDIGVTEPEDLGPNFNVERNAKIDNISKPLLRTNPRLTTNAKLVVNEGDEIYLESINATDALASSRYKKFPVNPNGSYAFDLARFYRENNTPLEIAYTTKRKDSDLSVFTEYEKQIEEDYQYGTTLNYSKLHDAEFRMFAPIYLDLNVPKKFVIFRVNDPKYRFEYDNSASDNFNRIQSMLRSSEIVKVFDLSKFSNIGKYLRSYVQDQSFPKSAITFSFEENEKSTFNGIDLIKGGFASKGEYLHNDFILKDKPMISANDFITDGFRRNSIAVANVINLEFLFDDPDVDSYSVNRYFGLYVDDIPTGTGLIESSDSGNIYFNKVTSYMSSTYDFAAIPSSKMISEMPILAYASIGDEYYKLDSSKNYDHSRYEVRVVDPKNEIKDKTGIAYNGNSIDVESNPNRGFDFIKVKVVDNPGVNDKIALINIKNESYRFECIKFVNNVNVTLGDTLGNTLTFDTGANPASALSNLETAFNNNTAMSSLYSLETNVAERYFIITEKDANLLNLSPSITQLNGCVIKRTEIYTNVEITNKTYYAADPTLGNPGYLNKGTFSGQSFSSAGSTTDVAIALTKLINSRGDFNAFNLGSDIYISIKIPGYKILQHAFLYSRYNNISFLEFEDINIDNGDLGLSDSAAGNSGIWDAYLFKGGHINKKSVYVTKETAPVINIGDYLPTAYNNRYNQVIDIVENLEGPNGDYLKIILKDVNELKSGEVRVFSEPELEMGLFSAYNIYDMDFDFYDKSNSDLKELNYEEFDVIDYKPYKDIYDNGNLGLETSDVLSDDYLDAPDEYFQNLQPVLVNESPDDVIQEQVESEYDRLKENEIKEFALASRIVPNINKWVLRDGMTVREEPYHLNANSAFGRTNFSPDLEVTNRDKRAFTHEWFYIYETPDYLRYWQINEVFNYVNFIKGFDLQKSDFKRVDRDYFDMFMVGEGHEVRNYTQDPLDADVTKFDSTSFIKANMNKKYTLIDSGSSENFASTIFKGLKVLFKQRKEFTNDIASEFVKNTEFNGYKFSTMVKVNTDVSSNSVDYEVIQNKKFKYVIFFINLNISEEWISTLNRKLLYELKHKIFYNITDGLYEYADIPLSGAIDFVSANFNGNGPYTVTGIADVDGVETKFTKEISKNTAGTFNKVQIDLPGIGVYEFDVISVESDNELLIKNKPTLVGNPSIELDTTGLNLSTLRSATYTYMFGGLNVHDLVLSELSAGNVASILADNDNKVKYTTIQEDGTQLDNRFTINFDDGKEIIKKVDLKVIEDTDKPKSYTLLTGNSASKLSGNYLDKYDSLKKIIGYKIVNSSPYYEFMVRHSGNYTIDLEPVVTFTDIYTHFKSNRSHITLDPYEIVFEEEMYKHSLRSSIENNIARSYYNKFNRCGVAFNVGFIKDSSVLSELQGVPVLPKAGKHDDEWAMIKNHHFHKVNEVNPNGVIKLTKSNEFLPLYPLINEIAIDKKDINVFRSSWESGYYTRSLAGGNSINIAGTFDTAEERSYLGSTVMKLKDVYYLTEFTTQRVNSEEELDDILRTSNNDRDVVIYEDNQNLIIDFYLDDVVYQKLSSLGALNTLTRFIDPKLSIGDKTTLEDDMRSYVAKNLIDVFTVDQIDLWVKRFKGKESEVLSTSSINLLDNDGFTKDQSFTYRKHGDTPLNFRLIYNKRLGYSYDIRPMIKIQS
jgi:hypothetical protein